MQERVQRNPMIFKIKMRVLIHTASWLYEHVNTFKELVYYDEIFLLIVSCILINS